MGIGLQTPTRNPSVPARSKVSTFIREYYVAYVFSGPAVLFLVGLLFVPMLYVFYLSFRQVNLLLPAAHGFVGWQNYVYVLRSAPFWLYVRHDVVWTLGSVLGEYVVGMTTAVLLDQKIIGRAFFRGIIIVPWLVPIAVASVVWTWILDPSYGILDYLLKQIGLMPTAVDWLGTPSLAMLSIIFINIWRSFPLYTLMLLASLQAVPKEEIDAALIDGASAFQRFVMVKFPYLKIASIVLVGLNVMWVFNNFSFIWLLTTGGPITATTTPAIEIYQEAFQSFNFGDAAALAVLMILLLFVTFVVVRALFAVWQKLRVPRSVA